MMKNARVVIVLSIVLLLSGCGLRVALRGELDPAYAPKRTEPVALILPDNSSIEDRQVFPVLKRELLESGFDLVEPDHAAWILGVATREKAFFSGIQTINVGKFGSVSNANYGSSFVIYLSLFQADAFRRGRRMAVWSGTEVTTPDNFRESPDKLVQALIDIYGVNFYDNSERVSEVKGDVADLQNQ